MKRRGDAEKLGSSGGSCISAKRNAGELRRMQRWALHVHHHLLCGVLFSVHFLAMQCLPPVASSVSFHPVLPRQIILKLYLRGGSLDGGNGDGDNFERAVPRISVPGMSVIYDEEQPALDLDGVGMGVRLWDDACEEFTNALSTGRGAGMETARERMGDVGGDVEGRDAREESFRDVKRVVTIPDEARSLSAALRATEREQGLDTADEETDKDAEQEGTASQPRRAGRETQGVRNNWTLYKIVREQSDDAAQIVEPTDAKVRIRTWSHIVCSPGIPVRTGPLVLLPASRCVCVCVCVCRNAACKHMCLCVCL